MLSHSIGQKVLIVAVFFLVVGCKDDPELVKKREQQKIEIERLKGEIAIKEEMIQSMPIDKSHELAQAKAKAELQTSEVEKLENEVADLQKQKRTLDDEVENYKKKYPLNR